MAEKTLIDCIWAVAEKYEDGTMLCPLLGSGTWTCFDCMKILEKQEEEGRL